MSSFFKGNQLYRQDANGNYRKINDIIPRHHWKLQEESGTVVNDSGHTPIPLTNNGATVDQTGKIDKAYLFDIGDYLEASFSWQPTEFSITFWIKHDTSGGKAVIISGDPGNHGWGMFCFHSSSGDSSGAALYCGTDVTTRFDNDEMPHGTLPNNEWAHFIFTYDGAIGKIYKNGVLLATKSMNLPQTWTGLSVMRYAGSVNYALVGNLEDLRIYDHALSVQEIYGIFDGWGGTYSQSLLKNFPTVGHPACQWKLQEVSGTTINDAMGLAAMTGSNLSFNEIGPNGIKAIGFNGSSSKCETSLPSALKLPVGSITAWVDFGDIPVNTEAVISITKPGENTRLLIRRGGTGETLQAFCQENGTYAWNLTSDFQLTGSGWIHVALIQNSVEPKLYINGDEVSVSYQINTDKSKWLTHTNFNTINLGVTRASGTYGYLNGSLCDVRMYGYPLQAQEVINIYNAGKGTLISS
jgi:hypothetical protein